jgi:hypothetical protein
MYILESVRHAGRNVKYIAGLYGLLDSALDRSTRGVVGIGPLFHIQKLAPCYCCRAAGTDQPDIKRVCVYERLVCRSDDSNIDAVASAFEHPFV